MNNIKAFFQKYWLKLVIVFCIIFGILLIFRFFSGNNKLKEKLQEIVENSRIKINEIETEKKINDVKIQIELQQNEREKKFAEQSLEMIKVIPNRKKRLQELIDFHKRLKQQ